VWCMSRRGNSGEDHWPRETTVELQNREEKNNQFPPCGHVIGSTSIILLRLQLKNNSSSRPPFGTVMQSADLRQFNDRPYRWRLNGSGFWRIFLQRQVRARPMVISAIDRVHSSCVRHVLAARVMLVHYRGRGETREWVTAMNRQLPKDIDE
jgi:hypothetical protein